MKHIDIHSKQVKALDKFIKSTKKMGVCTAWVNNVQADIDCMSIKIGGTI